MRLLDMATRCVLPIFQEVEKGLHGASLQSAHRERVTKIVQTRAVHPRRQPDAGLVHQPVKRVSDRRILKGLATIADGHRIIHGDGSALFQITLQTRRCGIVQRH